MVFESILHKSHQCIHTHTNTQTHNQKSKDDDDDDHGKWRWIQKKIGYSKHQKKNDCGKKTTTLV